MGSYAHLEVAGYPFFAMKSYVDSKIMSLFDEQHHHVYSRRISDRNPITWGAIEVDLTAEQAFEYRISAENIKRRLTILGFDEQRVKKTFSDTLEFYCDSLADDGFVSGLPVDDKEASEFLRNYSFSDWCGAIQQYVDPTFSRPNHDRESLKAFEYSLQLICLHEDNPSTDFLYGFPCWDFRLFVQAVLIACGLEQPVVLDYSELVHAGYYDGFEKLADAAKQASFRETDATAKIIVLTEGKSDARLLRRSMDLFHPELASLYSFVDFASPNMEGGVGNLVRVVKGFIGGGVTNKVIALFDNDSAAHDAMRALASINVPDNVVLLNLPDVPYASDYPTIGPSGFQNMNVNGLAGGIELYFGETVLRQADETFTPVQWRGYIQSLKKYQGELSDKLRLQKAFELQLDEYASDPTSVAADWSGIELILEAIFNAFPRDSDQVKSESGLFLPYF